MEAIVYYLFYGVNWIMTLLPLRVLYVISDVVYLGLYYFPSYRRKIVSLNLRNSFPEKSSGELKDIEKKFYRHLADLLIETLKLTHLSRKSLLKRFTISNADIIEKLEREKEMLLLCLDITITGNGLPFSHSTQG